MRLSLSNIFCSPLGSPTLQTEKSAIFALSWNIPHIYRGASEHTHTHTRRHVWINVCVFFFAVSNWNRLREWSLAICNKQLIFYNQFFWLRKRFFHAIFFFHSIFAFFTIIEYDMCVLSGGAAEPWNVWRHTKRLAYTNVWTCHAHIWMSKIARCVWVCVCVCGHYTILHFAHLASVCDFFFCVSSMMNSLFTAASRWADRFDHTGCSIMCACMCALL